MELASTYTVYVPWYTRVRTYVRGTHACEDSRIVVEIRAADIAVELEPVMSFMVTTPTSFP